MATKANAFAKAISKTATPATNGKKKTDHPVIVLEGDDAKALSAFNAHKKAMKVSETAMRESEPPLIARGMAVLDSDAFAGKFTNTYELRAGEESGTFITADKFSVPQDDEAIGALRDVLKDKFDQVLVQKTSVSLKEEIFADEAMQEELMKLVGDKFAKFFEVETKWSAVDGLNEKIYKIAGDEGTLGTIRSLIKQSKPGIR